MLAKACVMIWKVVIYGLSQTNEWIEKCSAIWRIMAKKKILMVYKYLQMVY